MVHTVAARITCHGKPTMIQPSKDDEFADVQPRQVTVIGPDVRAEMHRLRIPSEIRDEVLGCIAQLPPAERVAWLRRVFCSQ